MKTWLGRSLIWALESTQTTLSEVEAFKIRTGRVWSVGSSLIREKALLDFPLYRLMRAPRDPSTPDS
jgi:hypothetical protein